jgi:dTDP-4-dehydrorhamnose reductase
MLSNMRRIAVTGAGGFVAGNLIEQMPAGWEIHALSGKPPLARREGLAWHTLDLKRPDEVDRTFIAIAPDVIVHAAAVADIDLCECDPALARLMNVDLTRAVAQAAARHGSRLVYLSTDTVFDGNRGNYREEDPPSPINEYARTKAAAERIVAESVRDAVIVRLALVMGFGLLGGGNSFLERTAVLLGEGRTIDVPAEEIRTPIDVVTLGRALAELAAIDFRGILHLAGLEALNRVELTQRVARRLGYSPSLVVARPPEAIPGRAARPRDVSLATEKARGLLATPLCDFASSIERVLKATPQARGT